MLPLLILRSLKGWTGVKELDGKPVEGSFRAHQVPVPDVKKSPGHLKLVEDWLRSYRPEELFNEEGRPAPDILALCPQGDRRIGCNPHTLGGRIRRPLTLPDIRDHAAPPTVEEQLAHGRVDASSVEAVAKYLAGVIAANPRTFRIFSPDELMSNKLGGVFEAPTERDYQWPVEGGGHSEHVGARGGRVLEILSEHTCQAWLQGYLLTGRHEAPPSDDQKTVPFCICLQIWRIIPMPRGGKSAYTDKQKRPQVLPL